MLSSPFANLFIALQDYILAQVPDIKWVDQDFGQLESYKEGMRPAVMFPCVLLDFSEFTFADESKLIQTGEGFITLRIAVAPYTASNNAAAESQKEKALQAYELEQIIYTKLHGFQFSNLPFGKLLRRSIVTEKREDTIRVREIRFATSIKDGSAIKTYNNHARPDVLIGTDMLP